MLGLSRTCPKAMLTSNSWLRGFAVGLLLTTCTSPSTNELLEGKKCSPDGRRCADGYTCDSNDVCIPVGTDATGGAANGGSSGANAIGAGATSLGEAGAVATGATAGTAGKAGTGGAPATGGEAGSGGVAAGGGTETGGTETGGAPPSTGGAGTGGSIDCAGPVEDCMALVAALRHRYSFEAGPGAVDSVSGSNGTLERGATLTGDGAVELSGGTYTPGGFVDLPNGIVSALTDATMEAWVNWDGVGGSWQRIFDFGDAMATTCVAGGASAQEGSPGVCGRTYLDLCANTDGYTSHPPRVSFLTQPGIPTDDALTLDSSTNLPANSEQHLAVVVHDTADRLTLYRNGEPDGSFPLASSLSEINDINNWLGRSLFTGDPTFDGEILEFRIYDAALTDGQLATSFAAGPDAEFLK